MIIWLPLVTWAPVKGCCDDQVVVSTPCFVSVCRSVAELIAAVVNSGLGHVVARSGQGAAFRSKEWPMLAFADKVRSLAAALTLG
jgi:hypothetical protein